MTNLLLQVMLKCVEILGLCNLDQRSSNNLYVCVSEKKGQINNKLIRDKPYH